VRKVRRSKKAFVFNKGSWMLDPKRIGWLVSNKAEPRMREMRLRLRLNYLDELIKHFGWKHLR
jgi:hypothetical protein